MLSLFSNPNAHKISYPCTNNRVETFVSFPYIPTALLFHMSFIKSVVCDMSTVNWFFSLQKKKFSAREKGKKKKEKG